MSFEIIAFLSGVFFISISIFGSGLKIREIEVPNVSKSTRTISAILGVALLILGVYLGGYIKFDNSVTFTIKDVLYPPQIKENINIHIQGKRYNLNIKQEKPNDSIIITVPKKGNYPYMLNGHLEYKEKTISVSGSGKIDIQGDELFDIEIEQDNSNIESSVSLKKLE